MGDPAFSTITESSQATEALGFALAAMLPVGAVLALRGELAAGKTCFARGVVRRLAPDAAVSSPTFTLINEYAGAMRIYHADLYRLDSLSEIRALGAEDLFAPEDGITIVEWAERAEALLPGRRLDIAFEHAQGDRRRITIRDGRVLESAWQTVLQEALG